MKVSNYKVCGSGNKGEKIQNKDKGIELRLPFKEGLTLEIKRLSLTRSSEGEEQEERILKLSRDAVWSVSERCAKILDGVEVTHFLPIKAETPKWSETRVCKWRAVWPTYNWLSATSLLSFRSLSNIKQGLILNTMAQRCWINIAQMTWCIKIYKKVKDKQNRGGCFHFLEYITRLSVHINRFHNNEN